MDGLGPELLSRLRTEEPLARHTTFRIGGPAEFFVTVTTLDELIQAANSARERGIHAFVLGGGSNLLVRDKGMRGLIIENQCRAFDLSEVEVGKGILSVESGAPLPLVANQISRKGWSGIEWGIGVPGTVGGAVIGNAGAHGSSIADTLIRVTVLDRDGKQTELPKSDLGFSYRHSRLKTASGTIVLKAHFVLIRDNPHACITRMNAYSDYRRRTQPTQASVGSIFKNPPGQYAARLIEEAGLKGTRIGDAEISPVHANFVINHGNATAFQVLELIDLAKRIVFEKSGVTLDLEIEVVGDQ